MAMPIHGFMSIEPKSNCAVLGGMLQSIKQFFLDLKEVWLAYIAITSVAILLAYIFR